MPSIIYQKKVTIIIIIRTNFQVKRLCDRLRSNPDLKVLKLKNCDLGGAAERLSNSLKRSESLKVAVFHFVTIMHIAQTAISPGVFPACFN